MLFLLFYYFCQFCFPTLSGFPHLKTIVIYLIQKSEKCPKMPAFSRNPPDKILSRYPFMQQHSHLHLILDCQRLSNLHVLLRSLPPQTFKLSCLFSYWLITKILLFLICVFLSLSLSVEIRKACLMNTKQQNEIKMRIFLNGCKPQNYIMGQ